MGRQCGRFGAFESVEANAVVQCFFMVISCSAFVTILCKRRCGGIEMYIIPLTDETNQFSGLRALWVGIVWNWCIHFINMNLFPMRSGASEWASKWAQRSARAVRSTRMSERANDQVANGSLLYASISYHSYPMVGRTGGRTNPRRPKNNTPICMIDFDQAVVQFPCKFLVASIVLGCNKKIITKEKVDFG